MFSWYFENVRHSLLVIKFFFLWAIRFSRYSAASFPIKPSRMSWMNHWKHPGAPVWPTGIVGGANYFSPHKKASLSELPLEILKFLYTSRTSSLVNLAALRRPSTIYIFSGSNYFFCFQSHHGWRLLSLLLVQKGVA